VATVIEAEQRLIAANWELNTHFQKKVYACCSLCSPAMASCFGRLRFHHGYVERLLTLSHCSATPPARPS
jgi:hypothetical protein